MTGVILLGNKICAGWWVFVCNCLQWYVCMQACLCTYMCDGLLRFSSIHFLNFNG